MKRKIMYIISIIVLLPLVLLLTTLELVAFDKDFYMDKYKEYNIVDSTGIKMDDLSDITDKLIAYLKDDRDDLHIKKDINGAKEEVFGERELLHMKDVKELFVMGHIIRNISLLVVILAIIALIIKDKKVIGKTLITSSIISFILIIILFLLMNTDFDKYFTHFHEIFFTNDLWLLNPDTDVLIQMLPLEFFYSIATKISSLFIIELIVVIIIGLISNRTYKLLGKGNN